MNIPVSFEYRGKSYHGHFAPVNGAGNKEATTFQLYIGNGYRGVLHLAEDSLPGLPRQGETKYSWRFSSQTGEFEDMTDYFISVVIAWYE
jgi:hypothetical protein